jgi:hypothetical protein
MHKVKKRSLENKRGLGMEKGYLQKKIHCDLMSSPMFFSFVYGLFTSVVDDVVILQFFTLFKAPTMTCFK